MTQRDKWKHRPAVANYHAFRDVIRLVCRDVPPAAEVLALRVEFRISPPPSWSAKRKEAAIGQLCRSKPDVDNLLKGVMDSLWPKADQQLAEVLVRKVWARKSETAIVLLLDDPLDAGFP